MLGKSSVRSDAQLRLPWGKEKPLQFLFLTHHVHTICCDILFAKLWDMVPSLRSSPHVLRETRGESCAQESCGCQASLSFTVLEGCACSWNFCCRKLSGWNPQLVWTNSQLLTTTLNPQNGLPAALDVSCWEKLTSGMSQSTLLSWVRVRVRVATQKDQCLEICVFAFETWSVCFSFLFFLCWEKKQTKQNKTKQNKMIFQVWWCSVCSAVHFPNLHCPWCEEADFQTKQNCCYFSTTHFLWSPLKNEDNLQQVGVSIVSPLKQEPKRLILWSVINEFVFQANHFIFVFGRCPE